MWLPAAERRGEIHFHFGKSLPYAARLRRSFALIATGFLIQAVFYDYGLMGLLPGLAVVFAGVGLLLPRGYENRPDTARPGSTWRSARREEVARIIEVNRKQKAWDRDAVDITSGIGVVTLLGVAVCTWVVVQFVGGFSGTAVAFVVGNVAVMLLPFWVTGVRSILKNDKLVVKAGMLLSVEDTFSRMKPRSGEEFQYQMQTAETKAGDGSVPTDVKALVAFREGPADFLGVQMQVAINSVQGKDYPYFYCVLVAKPEFGGLSEPSDIPDGVVAESKQQKDVDVLVIRQRTTKNSGYHTSRADAQRIFAYALAQARGLMR